MSNNMNSRTKKRRVDDHQGRLSSVAVGEDKLMQTLNQLLEINRTQMAVMSSMQGEISRLTNESNQMKQTINAMQTAQNTISENMNSRFDVVDNKLNYHKVLLKNQQWKYSAPRPSPGYWDGVEDGDEEGVEHFLAQIKQCTEEMRYGTGNGEIYIDLSNFGVLPYNEEFLPHWNEFANALEQYQYYLKCLTKDTDAKLCLWNMELPNEVVELLSKALETTHFNHFFVGNNSLGQRGIDFALKYLKSNCILKVFSLYGNPIECMTKIEQLCEIVEEHPSIEKLYLGGCRGEGVNGYEMLRMILSASKNNLKALSLSGNGISTGGDTFISDFLAGNPILKCLNLLGNQLDDNDAIAIAGALKHNKNLRAIDVRNNNISKRGWETLRKAEFDDTSLNSAADSNHTCTIWYPSEIQGFDAGEMNGNPYRSVSFRPMYVRQKKVYSILSSRNRQCSNVGHFDDVPVEFLPDMLSAIQQYSEYHTGDTNIGQGLHDANPLSIVYEVCRHWDKSLALYESLLVSDPCKNRST